jgi:hypothetical protein
MTKTKAKREPTYLLDRVLPPTDVTADGFLAKHNPRFHFDYVESDVMNALAFESENIEFIGITIPLVEKLWSVCEWLSITPEIAMRFDSETTEQRQALQIELFSTVLGFVVCHEYGHHMLGHQVHHDEIEPYYNDMVSVPGAGSIESQAREIHADGFAIYFVIHGLIVGDRRASALANLGQTTEEALLCLFIVSVVAFFFIFGPREFDPGAIDRLTHPPSAIRLTYVMRHVQRWCCESRALLLPALTLTLVEEILWTVEEATWGRNAPPWPEQVAFAGSAEGQAYQLRLNAEYDRLQEWNRSRDFV